MQYNNLYEKKSDNSEFVLDKKLSELLRHHITIKYTQNEKKSNSELTQHVIDLELLNSELERKNEMLRMENLKKDQMISDLKIELNENRIKTNISQNKLKIIESTFSSLGNLNRDKLKLNVKNSDSKNRNKNTNESIEENSSQYGSSIIEELSIEQEEANSILREMKKNKKIHKNFEDKNLQHENETLIDNINLMTNEVESLRETIEEKDKIIQILYREIKKENNTIDSNKLIHNHHEYFSQIRRELIEFLKYYGINEIKEEIESDLDEDESHCKDIMHFQSKIENKMNDINYMLRNMNKINIIFKSLMVDFSKNLLRNVEKTFSFPLSYKLNNLSNRYNKLNSVLDKISISLK